VSFLDDFPEKKKISILLNVFLIITHEVHDDAIEYFYFLGGGGF
jgi:hypothetical protein